MDIEGEKQMDNIKKYFEENSEFWIKDAYTDSGYSYPVGYNRLRILNKIIQDHFSEGKNLLDIGCGGGDVAIIMAQKGFNVVGLDMSEAMIEIAQKRKEQLPSEIADRLTFKQMNFDEIVTTIKEDSVDIIVAFGFIGYLSNDEIFFETCNKILKDRGKLIISCRNRLFNMQSISDYTTNEILNNDAIKLISEIDELYCDEIPKENTLDFIKRLKETINAIQLDEIEKSFTTESSELKTIEIATFSIEARQHIPSEIKKIAYNFGFESKRVYGVHPHLILPKLNSMLPPQLFNVLSDTLCAFEDLQISLLWSSVFIIEYEIVK